MRTVTVDDILSWSPCWTKERVRAACAPLGGRFTALDVLLLEDVPPEDRLWVVLREEMLDAATLRLFAVACVRWALMVTGWDDPRSARACDVAEAYALGDVSLDELTDAGDAARDATARDARAAAGDATAAAWAAWAAAWAAAVDARTAAWSAAWSAAWATPVEALIAYLTEEADR